MATILEKRSVEQAISAWQSYIKRIDGLLEKLPEDVWYHETAPGRNRGIYLLGHLVAVHDGFNTLFSFGEKQYPAFEKLFLTDPDNKEATYPSFQDLKTTWKNQNLFLNNSFAAISVEDWYSRHTAVSEADFEINPLRNKLNVLLNRTNHMAYHLGQLIYLD